MKKTYSIKVVQHKPVEMEGHITIRATSAKKALQKLEEYGDYEVEEVKKVKKD